MYRARGRIGIGALAACFYALGHSAHAADALENETVRAEFGVRGLVAIADKPNSQTVRFTSDDCAVYAGNESVESEFLLPTLEQQSPTNRVYRFDSGPWTVRVIYELQPGWHFVSKQLTVANSGKKETRVQRFEIFRGRVETPIAAQLRIRDGTLLRFAEAAGA